MFALYVRQMCCKLELKTLNNRKTTASLQNHQKRPCITRITRNVHCDTRVFSANFCMKSEEYFPRSFDIVVISDIPTRYLIFCTKWESSLFLIDNIRNVTWPFLSAFIFPAAWRVFVRKHRKVCCRLLQWSNAGTVVWCRTCTALFQEFIFKFSADLGVRNESTVKTGIFPRQRFETGFFYT